MTSSSIEHHYQDLITIFNQTFFDEYNTKLELGGDEPLYLPAGMNIPDYWSLSFEGKPIDKNCHYHRIIFARGFYASAFHEIAHWCVAGRERRLLEDFGYWYQPDGRDQQLQAQFEKVEIRPQAYEWILAQSAQFPFTVSCDNLNGNFDPDRLAFMEKVRQEVLSILENGLPPRVQLLSTALCDFYQTQPLQKEQFKVK